MRLLIASDIHGSAAQAALLKAKAESFQPDLVLLLGDLLYHGPRNPLPDSYSPPEVAAALSALRFPLAAVRGNCDAEVDQMVLPFPLMESSWIIDGAARIMAIHGHQLALNGGPIQAPKNSVLLSGHTHLPTAEERDGVHYWNPGSASLPKGGFPPSYGLYADGRFQVMTFDDQALMRDSL